VTAPRPSNPLRGGTSGKPEVNVIQAWSFVTQNSQSNCRNSTPGNKYRIKQSFFSR
jgi:hypothetical protein